MRRIFIDSQFRCHVKDQDGTLTPIDTDFFDGKCDAYVEGYRFVPEGKSWTRHDGKVFHGEMIAPWRDHRLLREVQLEYEKERLTNAETVLAIMLGDELL